MKGMKAVMAVVTAALVLVAFQAFAGPDHKDFVKGPFKDGQSVTKVCLECHEQQAADVMKTSHWTWAGTPNHVKGMEKSTKQYGKTNMINAFCTTVFNGPDGVVRESCHKCHAGYGWTRTKFDLTDKTRVDCLVCHAQKGNYARAGVGADVDQAAIKKGSMNLEEAAQSVGAPTLKNCGYCHFYGGGRRCRQGAWSGFHPGVCQQGSGCAYGQQGQRRRGSHLPGLPQDQGSQDRWRIQYDGSL